MEQYRFKCYYSNGNVIFQDIPWALKPAIFERAYQKVMLDKLIEKVDVYYGTKLIATFYK